MSTEIDRKVVEMKFDNREFEKNVKSSMSIIDKLKEKLKFSGVEKGFKNIEDASRDVDMSPLEQSVDSIGKSFSAFEQVAIGSLRRIGEQAIDAGEKLVKSLTIDNISAGWQKFGQDTSSVGTLISQGFSIEEVEEQLERLIWFTDETSYNYTEMVNTIGKFTAVGMGLEESVNAVEGIALWAAKSGQNAQKASHAMTQLAQAMGGFIRKTDYDSISNLSMDTDEFRQLALDTAVAMGTLRKTTDGLYEATSGKGSAFSKSQFVDHLTKEAWFTKDVFEQVMHKYASTVDYIYDYVNKNDEVDTASQAIEELEGTVDDFGLAAFKAGQEARTFTDVIDSVKDAVSTGWMKTFKLLIGNYNQATKTWTKLSNDLWDIFAAGSYARNDMLKEWNKLGENYKGMAETYADFFEKKFGFPITEADIDTVAAYNTIIDRSKSGTELLAESFFNIIHLIRDVKDSITNIWETFFPSITAEKLYDITFAIKQWTDGFTLIDEDGELTRKGQRFNDVILSIVGVLRALYNVTVGNVLNVLKALGEAFGETFGDTEDVLDWIVSKIKLVAAVIVKLLNKLTITEGGFEKIKTVFSSIFEIATNTLESVGEIVAALIPGKDILTSIVALFSSLIGFIASAYNGIKEFVVQTGILDAILTGIMTGVIFIAGTIESAINIIKPSLMKIWDFIKELDFKKGFENVGSNAVAGFGQGFKNGVASIYDTVKNFGISVIEKLKSREVFDIHSPSRTFRRIAEMCLVGFAAGIVATNKEVLVKIKEFAVGAVEETKHFFSGRFQEIGPALQKFGDSVRDFLGISNFNDLIARLGDLASVLLLFELATFTKKFGDAVWAISDIGDSINRLSRSIRNRINASAISSFVRSLSVAIIIISLSFGIVTDTIKDLGPNSDEIIWKAAGIIGGVMLALIGISVTLAAILKPGKLNADVYKNFVSVFGNFQSVFISFSAVVIAFAFLVREFTKTILSMKDMNLTEKQIKDINYILTLVGKLSIAIGAFLLALVAINGLFTKIKVAGKDDKIVRARSSSLSILAAALAVKIIIPAIKSLIETIMELQDALKGANVSDEYIEKALVIIYGALGSVAAFVAAVSLSSQNLGDAVVLIVTAYLMRYIASAMGSFIDTFMEFVDKIMKLKNFEKTYQTSLGILAGVSVFMMSASFFVTKVGKSMTGLIISLIGITVTTAILINEIDKLSSKWNEYTTKSAGIASGLFALMAAFVLTASIILKGTKNAEDMDKMIMSFIWPIVGIIAGIDILILSMKRLGEMDKEGTLTHSTISMVAIIAAIGAVIDVMIGLSNRSNKSNLWQVTLILLGAVASILALVVGLKHTNIVDADVELARKVARCVSGILYAVTALMLVLGLTGNKKSTAIQKKVNDQNASNVKKNLGMVSVLLLSISEVIAVIAGSIWLLSNYGGDKLVAASIIAGSVLAAVTVLFITVTAMVKKFPTDLIKSAGIMKNITVFLIAFSGCISAIAAMIWLLSRNVGDNVLTAAVSVMAVSAMLFFTLVGLLKAFKDFQNDTKQLMTFTRIKEVISVMVAITSCIVALTGLISGIAYLVAYTDISYPDIWIAYGLIAAVGGILSAFTAIFAAIALIPASSKINRFIPTLISITALITAISALISGIAYFVRYTDVTYPDLWTAYGLIAAVGGVLTAFMALMAVITLIPTSVVTGAFIPTLISITALITAISALISGIAYFVRYTDVTYPDLWEAYGLITAVGGILTAFMALMAVITLIPTSSKINAFIPTLISITALITVISALISGIAYLVAYTDITYPDLWTAYGLIAAVGGVLTAFMALMAVITLIPTSVVTGAFIPTLISITALITAISALISGIAYFVRYTDVTYPDLWEAYGLITAVGGILTAFVALMAVITLIPTSSFSIFLLPTLIAVTKCIAVLSDVVYNLANGGNQNYDAAEKVIENIKHILLSTMALIGLIGLIPFVGINGLTISVAMIGVSNAITIIANTIKAIAQTNLTSDQIESAEKIVSMLSDVMSVIAKIILVVGIISVIQTMLTAPFAGIGGLTMVFMLPALATSLLIVSIAFKKFFEAIRSFSGVDADNLEKATKALQNLIKELWKIVGMSAVVGLIGSIFAPGLVAFGMSAALIAGGIYLISEALVNFAEAIGIVAMASMNLSQGSAGDVAANISNYISAMSNALMVGSYQILAALWSIGDIIGRGLGGLFGGILMGIASNIEMVSNGLISILIAILNVMSNKAGELVGAATDFILNILDAITTAVQNNWDKIVSVGKSIRDTFIDAIFDTMDTHAASKLFDRLSGATSKVSAISLFTSNKAAKDALSAGDFIAKSLNLGFNIGLKSNSPLVEKTVRDTMNDAVVVPAKDEVETHSPSRVFQEIGENCAEGLIVGFTASEQYLDDSVTAVMGGITDAAANVTERAKIELENKSRNEQRRAQNAFGEAMKSMEETFAYYEAHPELQRGAEYSKFMNEYYGSAKGQELGDSGAIALVKGIKSIGEIFSEFKENLKTEGFFSAFGSAKDDLTALGKFKYKEFVKGLTTDGGIVNTILSSLGLGDVALWMSADDKTESAKKLLEGLFGENPLDEWEKTQKEIAEKIAQNVDNQNPYDYDFGTGGVDVGGTTRGKSSGVSDSTMQRVIDQLSRLRQEQVQNNTFYITNSDPKAVADEVATILQIQTEKAQNVWG